MKKFAKLFVVLSLLSSVLLLASPSFADNESVDSANNSSTVTTNSEVTLDDSTYFPPGEWHLIEGTGVLKEIKPLYTYDFIPYAGMQMLEPDSMVDGNDAIGRTEDGRELFVNSFDDSTIQAGVPGTYVTDAVLGLRPTNQEPPENQIYIRTKIPVIVVGRSFDIKPIVLEASAEPLPSDFEPDYYERTEIGNFFLENIFITDNFGHIYDTFGSADYSKVEWHIPGVYSLPIELQASNQDGRVPPKYEDTIPVIIKSSEETKISISPENHTLKVGSSKVLKATITPETSNNKQINWRSSNSNIAKVYSNGKVQGVSPGTTTIEAYTSEYLIASCEITVVE